MDVLSAYLPMDRRWAWQNNEAIPAVAEGAVLFADVSGFTSLTAVLTAELGPKQGAEEMTRQINRALTAIIGEVHRYRGAVISFSGDAITCWFADDKGERAVTCATQMQVMMQEWRAVMTPTGQRQPLTVKVFVATGTVQRFVVGKPEIQQLDVLAGRPLNLVMIGQEFGESGAVVVTAEVAQHLGGQISVTGWYQAESGERFATVNHMVQRASSQPWPGLPAVSEEIAQQWVLPAVYERLQHHTEAFLAALRTAVIIFCRFEGVAYGEAAVVAEVDQYIRAVQDVVAEYEGELLQVSTGDKGNYFYIVFGSLRAHSDDVLRALRTALMIKELAKPLQFIDGTQMGVSVGQVYAGAYGSPARRTFGVLGNEVNVAARLMGRAENDEILVSPRVVMASENWFEFSPLGSLSLKGLREPLSIFRLEAALASPARVDDEARDGQSAPLVGRAEEKAQLLALLTDLLAGDGGWLFLEGDDGLGKSRLLHSLEVKARTQPLFVVGSRGEQVEQATPYFAWRSILRQLLLPPTADLALLQARVESWVGERPLWLPWLSLLNGILPVNWPETELVAQMTQEVRANNTRLLLLHLIRMFVRNNTLLLLFDDSHWLDSASWALLAQVHTDLPQVGVVMSLRQLERQEEMGRQMVNWQSWPNVKILRLRMLSLAAVKELLAWTWQVDQIDDAVVDFVYRQTEGHPLFCEEMGRTLQASGVVAVVAGRVEVAEGQVLSEVGLPETLQGAMANHLDRLPAQQQLALRVASVVGRAFSYQILYDVYPILAERARLPEILQSLVQQGVLLVEGDVADLAYSFKHILLRDIAYEMMVSRQREQLHEAISNWYERTYNNDLTAFYPLLAYHWQRAGVVVKAAAYWELAGEQALQQSAYQEAIEAFEQLLGLGPLPTAVIAGQPVDDERRARWHWQLAQAYYSLGQYKTSLDYLVKAVNLLGWPLSVGKGALLTGVAREIGRQILHRWLPRLFLDRAGEDEKRLLVLVGQIYQLMSVIAYVGNEQLLSFYVAIRLLNLGERLGVSPLLAEGYGTTSILMALFGNQKQAEKYYQRATKVAAEMGMLTQARVSLLTGVYLIREGYWDRLNKNLPEAIEAFKQLGDTRQWGEAMAMWGGVLGNQGLHSQAVQAYGEIRIPQNSVPLHQIIGAIWGAYHLGLQGLWAEALVLIKAACDELKPEIDAQLHVDSQAVLAWVYMNLGSYNKAWQAAELGRALIVEAGRGGAPFGHKAYGMLAEVYMKLWSLDGDWSAVEVKKNVRQMCRALRSLTPATEEPTLGRCWGEWLWLRGHKWGARRWWRWGLQRAKELSLPYEQKRLERYQEM
ncbi:MAG TPA: adenylate/guanylate cyclase domain-containing protein [Anaerolineae bacterium]|nr:adenylate/guanylate cyclase domain-containing protein [Anaerolineae bacterium]